jgi:predicted O-linked N-acetylglucosamine transferase (SPINDLY family)
MSDIQQLLSLAIQHHHKNEFDKARELYHQILAAQPDHPDALHLLGVLFHQSGNASEAESLIRKAISIRPANELYLFNLGMVLRKQGKNQEAVLVYQKALEIRSEYADAWYSLGNAFRDLGKIAEAISAYRQAVRVNPKYADAYINLGIALAAQGSIDDAMSAYRCALDADPNRAELYYNMGTVYQGQKKLDDAIACFQKALELKPTMIRALNNMGNAFQEQGKLNESLSCYKKAVEVDPSYAIGWHNAANISQYQSNFDDAIVYYQKSLELRPDDTDSMINLGLALRERDRVEESLECYRKAISLSPENTRAYSILIHQLQHVCRWEGIDLLIEKLNEMTRKAIENGEPVCETPFENIARNTDPARNFDIAKIWSRNIAKPISYVKTGFSYEQRRLETGRKIRIGYLSNDFFNHPVAHLMLRVFGLHDRNRFEIIGYSYGKDDGSMYRRQIQKDCDRFLDLRELSFEDAARRIYEDKPDILVDLMGHTKDNRIEICAFRPAPIQATWLGFPSTSGAEFFDYLIGDKITTPPEHAPYYSEKLVYLPHSYLVSDYQQPIFGAWKKSDLGYSENTFVFCSYNQPFKIDQIIFDVWMRILRQVPDSVLWLQRKDDISANSLRREAEKRGVAADRLTFLGKLPLKEEYLSRLNVVDLCLDTRIYNGHATTSDALWAGVPVITLMGSHFASRAASGELAAIGLSELITRSPEEYERLAVRLANTPIELMNLRQKLSKNRLTQPLFDTPRFVKNLEKAYQRMWATFQAGEVPKAIEVSEDMPEITHISPNASPDELHIMGLAARRENPEKAAELIGQAIRLSPANPIYYNNLSAIFCELNRLDDAVKSCQKALELDPNLPNAYCNMGLVLGKQGNFTEAMSWYRKAMSLNPNHSDAYRNMGNAFLFMEKPEQALLWYQKAVMLNSADADAYYNMGLAYRRLGRWEEASACFQKSLQITPDIPHVLGTLANLSRAVCSWKMLEELNAKVHQLTQKTLEQGSRPPETPLENLFRCDDPAINLGVTKAISRAIQGITSSVKTGFSFENRKTPNKKLVIGYLSGDFGNHPVGHLIHGLFGAHDRNQVEVNCYSYGEDDNSEYRKHIAKTCNKFIDIRELTYLQAAGRIYSDSVDILIDLAGYTQNSRLEICALRPAPIQISYLGFPGSVGAEFFDYLIADKIVVPEAQSAFYTEKLIWMPHAYQINAPHPISDAQFARKEFGLPEHGFVFCSFNQPSKIEPVMFELWMKLLRQIPQSVLWLSAFNTTAERNLRTEAQNRGVNPNRLIFAQRLPSKAEYLARLSLADMVLDTRLYNGHATTSDALWAGVPVITLQGKNFASRVGSSLLSAVGLPELITKNLQEYELLAMNLAARSDELVKIRQKLAKYRLTQPLFDTVLFARTSEQIYRAIWQLFVSGQSPRNIEMLAAPDQQTIQNPGHFYTLAAALQSQNRHDECIAAYEQAVRLKPDYTEAWVNLGVAWKNKGNNERAIFCYRKILEFKPDFAEIYYNLGNSLRDKPFEAIANYQKALQYKPDMVGAYINLGLCYHEMARSEEAIACYEKAVKFNPNLIEAYSNLISRLQHIFAWEKLETIKAKIEPMTVDAISKGVKTPEIPFDSLTLHRDPARHLASAKAWSADIARTAGTPYPPYSPEKFKEKKKITIGYLSCDFRNHPVAHLLRSMFGIHNRNEFNIYVYSYGPDDGSPYRKEIQATCDKFTDVHPLSHQDTAKRIMEDGVDILIDLMGHTKNARLEICALRPAPIQVTWLGFPGTSGADFFDYLITDKIISPPHHASYYSEKLVYMPHCYLMTDHRQAIWSPSPKRADAKLPQDAFVFCSFNQPFKIEHSVFDCWMRLLHQVPGSVLWLPRSPESAERNLKRQAEARGMDTSRLIFADKLVMKEQYLARLGLADLALDPWMYNGHATTSDALWSGVPVLTLLGTTFASRVASGLLNAMELSELITHTPEEYEKLALHLAARPDELARIRQKLAKNRMTAPLFDTPRFVRNLENAFRQMWKLFLSGEKPRLIEVESAPPSEISALVPQTTATFNIDGKVAQAFQFHNEGKLQEAAALYEEILQVIPNHADSLHLSGLILYRHRQYDKAIERIEKAIRISPNVSMYYSNLSAVYYETRRYEDVISCCKKALEINPSHTDAYGNMGLALKQLGRFEEAISCYDKTLQANPNHAESWFNKGVALHLVGKAQDALPCYEKAIAIKPVYPEAHFNWGNAFLALNRNEEALVCYNKASEQRPDYAEAHVNRGVIFQKQNRLDEAAECYRQAISVRENYMSAYSNLGMVLKLQKKYQEAIPCYEKAVQLKPDNAANHYELGDSWLNLGDTDKAMLCFQNAISLNPDYERAYSEILLKLQYSCSWAKMNDIARHLDAFTQKSLGAGKKPDESPFMSITRKTDIAENFKIAKAWANYFADTKGKFPLPPFKKEGGKIRIGYLSNDFRHHPVAHLMMGLFSLHDRQAFEVFCYSYGKDDGSDYRKRAMTQSDQFIDLRDMSNEESAKRIYADNIDILIDLMGYTTESRMEICAMRPAPIQITYLGFPGTSGADFFDYIITDKTITPDKHLRYYSECPIYMPHTYQINDVHRFAEPQPSKAALGLPENSFVFCSFNQPFKIEPGIFDAWMRILKQVPNSVLWLISWNQKTSENLWREAAARGVAPERLIFAKRISKEEHLARHVLADLVLDTRIYNGHTTTSDALWAGVPVITICGDHFASRVSASLLQAVGMPELITHRIENYESLALQLAYQPDKLNLLRQKLSKLRLTSPLFDTPRFTRNLEKAYKQIWHRYLSGQKPCPVEIREETALLPN